VNEDCPSKDEILGEIWNEFGRSNNQFSSFVTLVNPRNPGIFEVNQPPPERQQYTSTLSSRPNTSTTPPQAFPVFPPSQRPQLPSLDSVYSVHSVTPPRPETLPLFPPSQRPQLPSLDSVHSVTPPRPEKLPLFPPSQRPHFQLPSLDSVHSVTPPRPETLPPTNYPFVPNSPGWTGKFSEYRSDDLGQTDAKKE
jgi:hypothetical protein